MNEFEAATGMGAYLRSASSGPSVTITIAKVGNGYTLYLQTNPQQPVAYAPEPSPFEGMDPDEVIDKMVDGAGAVLRRLRGAEVGGEDWKDGDDRGQVREAVKAMFPGLARQITRSQQPPPEPPRHESLVFETKAKLMAFIEKEL